MSGAFSAYGRKLSSELIKSIKKRAAIPQAQKTYQDEDILRFANEEMDHVLLPLIIRVKEEFYVKTDTITLATGQTRVKIPYRAIGSKIRNLWIESASGGTRRAMTRIQPEDLTEFDMGVSNGSKAVFYLEGDNIVLISATGISTGDSLKVSYYLRPNDIVVENRVPQITRIVQNISTADIYLTSLPTHFEIGMEIDFIENVGNCQTIAYDIPVLDVNDNVSGEVRLTINLSDLPSGLIANDHVALSGETKVPQIPSDLHAVLAQAVACRILEAQSDPNLDRAEKTLAKMMDAANALVDTRTEGTPQKILQSGGFLKRKRYIG